MIHRAWFGEKISGGGFGSILELCEIESDCSNIPQVFAGGGFVEKYFPFASRSGLIGSKG
jgi:hypothetical protein